MARNPAKVEKGTVIGLPRCLAGAVCLTLGWSSERAETGAMAQSDDIGFTWADLRGAFGLLTRLPLPGDPGPAIARGARAAWAWPLAGAAVGVLAAIAAALTQALGLPPTIIAALALAMQAIVTGALHEDGLADSADGLWGGHSPGRRLEIMRDSRIGSYGVLALTLTLLIRWSALAALVPGGLLAALIACAALSRAPMAVLMAALPPARPGGLSRSVGRPPARAVWAGCALATLIGAALTGWAIVPLVLVLGAVTLGCGLIAQARIGGQTGDILGACQQLTEIAALCVLVALWS